MIPTQKNSMDTQALVEHLEAAGDLLRQEQPEQALMHLLDVYEAGFFDRELGALLRSVDDNLRALPPDIYDVLGDLQVRARELHKEREADPGDFDLDFSISDFFEDLEEDAFTPDAADPDEPLEAVDPGVSEEISIEAPAAEDDVFELDFDLSFDDEEPASESPSSPPVAQPETYAQGDEDELELSFDLSFDEEDEEEDEQPDFQIDFHPEEDEPAPEQSEQPAQPETYQQDDDVFDLDFQLDLDDLSQSPSSTPPDTAHTIQESVDFGQSHSDEESDPFDLDFGSSAAVEDDEQPPASPDGSPAQVIEVAEEFEVGELSFEASEPLFDDLDALEDQGEPAELDDSLLSFPNLNFDSIADSDEASPRSEGGAEEDGTIAGMPVEFQSEAQDDFEIGEIDWSSDLDAGHSDGDAFEVEQDDEIFSVEDESLFEASIGEFAREQGDEASGDVLIDMDLGAPDIAFDDVDEAPEGAALEPDDDELLFTLADDIDAGDDDVVIGGEEEWGAADEADSLDGRTTANGTGQYLTMREQALVEDVNSTREAPTYDPALMGSLSRTSEAVSVEQPPADKPDEDIPRLQAEPETPEVQESLPEQHEQEIEPEPEPPQTGAGDDPSIGSFFDEFSFSEANDDGQTPLDEDSSPVITSDEAPSLDGFFDEEQTQAPWFEMGSSDAASAEDEEDGDKTQVPASFSSTRESEVEQSFTPSAPEREPVEQGQEAVGSPDVELEQDSAPSEQPESPAQPETYQQDDDDVFELDFDLSFDDEEPASESPSSPPVAQPETYAQGDEDELELSFDLSFDEEDEEEDEQPDFQIDFHPEEDEPAPEQSEQPAQPETYQQDDDVFDLDFQLDLDDDDEPQPEPEPEQPAQPETYQQDDDVFDLDFGLDFDDPPAGNEDLAASESFPETDLGGEDDSEHFDGSSEESAPAAQPETYEQEDAGFDLDFDLDFDDLDAEDPPVAEQSGGAEQEPPAEEPPERPSWLSASALDSAGDAKPKDPPTLAQVPTADEALDEDSLFDVLGADEGDSVDALAEMSMGKLATVQGDAGSVGGGERRSLSLDFGSPARERSSPFSRENREATAVFDKNEEGALFQSLLEGSRSGEAEEAPAEGRDELRVPPWGDSDPNNRETQSNPAIQLDDLEAHSRETRANPALTPGMVSAARKNNEYAERETTAESPGLFEDEDWSVAPEPSGMPGLDDDWFDDEDLIPSSEPHEPKRSSIHEDKTAVPGVTGGGGEKDEYGGMFMGGPSSSAPKPVPTSGFPFGSNSPSQSNPGGGRDAEPASHTAPEPPATYQQEDESFDLDFELSLIEEDAPAPEPEPPAQPATYQQEDDGFDLDFDLDFGDLDAEDPPVAEPEPAPSVQPATYQQDDDDFELDFGFDGPQIEEVESHSELPAPSRTSSQIRPEPEPEEDDGDDLDDELDDLFNFDLGLSSPDIRPSEMAAREESNQFAREKTPAGQIEPELLEGLLSVADQQPADGGVRGTMFGMPFKPNQSRPGGKIDTGSAKPDVSEDEFFALAESLAAENSAASDTKASYRGEPVMGSRSSSRPLTGRHEPFERGKSLSRENPFAHEAPTGVRKALVDSAEQSQGTLSQEESDELLKEPTLEEKARALYEDGQFVEARDLLTAHIKENREPWATELLVFVERELERQQLAQLGSLTKTPVLDVKMSMLSSLNLDHRSGFLLSQIDGFMTFEDILDLSAMSRLETLEVLAELMGKGIIVAT